MPWGPRSAAREAAQGEGGSAPKEQPLPPQPEGPVQPKTNKMGLKNSAIHHTASCRSPRAERRGLREQQVSQHESNPREAGTCALTV